MDEQRFRRALETLIGIQQLASKIRLASGEAHTTLCDLFDLARSFEGEMCEAHDDRDRQLADMRAELRDLRAELEVRKRLEKNEVWFWQGDGEDNPESLACPVIISIDDFNKFRYWMKHFKESDTALNGLAEMVGNPCLELEEGETSADALARYIADRYIKTDEAWQEIQKNNG